MSRSFAAATADNVLNWLFSTTAYTPSPGTLTIALTNSVPNDLGATGEVTGGGYARQSITFGAASSGVVSNTNTITFPQATAPWGRIVGWGVSHPAVAWLALGYMGTFFDWAQNADGGADIVTSVIQAPANNQRVFFSTADPNGTDFGNVAAAGLLALEDVLDGYEYWVVNSTAPGGSSFQVALTQGGAPVNLADTFYGPVQVWTSKLTTVGIGDQLVFAPGSITISLK
jgi:hypothetical protein